ncbi:hypothetical protein HYU09_02480 [Candidatus Woesearchaeota archaeon]|nr:hypothetical protein [Candidatus Woesearchaeota archaeon]
MPIEFIIIRMVILLVLLFVIFDTIRRVKGKFNQGWKIMFLAFSLYFILMTVALLTSLELISPGMLLFDVLDTTFLAVILATAVIINRKVKEVHDGHKKVKYRK